MANLRIIDVSPVIYAGSRDTRKNIEGALLETVGGFKPQQIPSGGLAFLWNIIYEYGNSDTLIFCFDRPPTIKKAMWPDYKSGRTHPEGVMSQKDLAEELVRECGFLCCAKEGYEADDFIYDLCMKYKTVFDHIYVHTGDSDMYCVVDTNVEVVPSSSTAKHITYENFRNTVVLDKVIPYNMLTFEKILNGDKSDNIPPLPRALVMEMLRVLNTPFNQPRMGKRVFVRTLVEQLFPIALRQVDLVFPLPMDESDLEFDFAIVPNFYKASIWGYLIGNRNFAIPKKIPMDIAEKRASLFDR